MRAQLAVIVLVVAVAFVSVGAAVTRQNMQQQWLHARAEADYAAGIAAGAVARSLALAERQVSAAAGNPAVAPLLAGTPGCQLTFDLELFPGSHFDLVRPDGRTMCSSLALESVASMYEEALWLPLLATGSSTLFHSQPVQDDSGATSIVVGAPIHDEMGSVLGAVVVHVPITPLADLLTEAYGGPARYRFVVEHTGSDATLSAPADGVAGGAASLPRDVAGSSAVDGSDWRITATPAPDAVPAVRSILARGAVLGGTVLLVLLVAMGVVSNRIARPLRRLAAAVGDTGPHVEDRLLAVHGPQEVTHLADAFREAIALRRAYERDLLHQALHDPLTGLANRALLGERLAHSLEQATRLRTGVGVLLLDLDRFKLINDGLGHGMGDDVLVTIAGRLNQVLRPGDTLARFGGDEFVVVGEDFPSPAIAVDFAERLLEVAALPVQAGDTIVRVTASIGIAMSTGESLAADLLRDADVAMYRAKKDGGARTVLFGEELRDEVGSRLTLENELRVALDRRELHVAYQPKVDLATGDTVGVEALLRWEHPALGAISPDTFIPIAEETGLIIPIGRFVLDQACHQAAAWRADGFDIGVAVNVSARQIADVTFPRQVADVLATSGLEARHVCLELTESVLMEDTAHTTDALEALHALGVKLSVDDFGTGYSSLGYLHQFPVDELKIDRMFVKDIDHRGGQRTLVAAMVAMARALGIEVVAEGVETLAEAKVLRTLGCQTAQGFLFPQPQRAAELETLLLARRTATQHDGGRQGDWP